MTPEAYAALKAGESSWWYQARASVVTRVMQYLLSGHDRQILDFGSGFGGMKDVLSRFGTVSAFEPNAEAAMESDKRGYVRVVRSEDDLTAETFDVICACDVLEHVPNDAATLASFHRWLRPRGYVLLTVPAYPSMWSSHDVSHHHQRRYARRTLQALLNEKGFDVIYLGFWNMLLFPVMYLARQLGRGSERALQPGRYANVVLRTILRAEEWLIPLIRLPFGSSLIVLARKRD